MASCLKSISMMLPGFCCPQTLRTPLIAISHENASGRGAACERTGTAGCYERPDKSSSTQRASPGKLGMASSGAHSICPVRHHQPQPPVTKCPHLQMCLRSGFPVLSFFFPCLCHFFFHVSSLVLSFLVTLPLHHVHLITHLINIALALCDSKLSSLSQIAVLVCLNHSHDTTVIKIHVPMHFLNSGGWVGLSWVDTGT